MVQRQLFMQRHPRLTLAAVACVLLLSVLLIFEIALRWIVDSAPGYYTGIEKASSEVEYPYGTIRFNALGFPDTKFDLSTNVPRVGYVGDSVVFGVGAGFGYRFTDLVRQRFPSLQHMNFGSIGKSIDDKSIARIESLARRYSLSCVVYAFNLNDILPTRKKHRGKTPAGLYSIAKSMKQKADHLLSKSYLYHMARSSLKNMLLIAGYGHTGMVAYEMYPKRYRAVVADTAQRINRLRQRLDEVNVRLLVLILPYEMQISESAARHYHDLGVSWEDGFLGGTTQQEIIENLQDVNYLNAIFAFVDPNSPQAGLNDNDLGEFFVFDRGGRLDWNHPNRAGHRQIADFLAASGAFEDETQLCDLAVSRAKHGRMAGTMDLAHLAPLPFGRIGG